MASYQDKREQNYEIKYLRKVLGQVDNRIRVPQSLDAQSMLALLDGIEQPSKIAPRRRPRWMSLQSGIAYAAAFALVVALFYSMEVYRPQVLHGGMAIEEQSPSSVAPAARAVPEAVAGEALQGGDDLILVGDGAIADEVIYEPEAGPAPEPEAPVDAPEAVAFGVGGTESTLLLEEGGASYYCRINDPSDPDRQAPVTLEIIDRDTLEYVAQIDVPEMNAIDRCFVSENRILLIGQDESSVVISDYDSTDPANPSEISSLVNPGEFVDARAYKDVVHVVSFADEPDNAVTLPNASSDDCVAITAYNTETGESYTKSFVGAKGTVQLHNLGAYIHYEGENEDGEPEYYIAQILLEGMDIELATVS